VVFFLALGGTVLGQLSDEKLSIGLRVGAARFDGDARIPTFRPLASGVLSFALNPHLSISGELGYAKLAVKNAPGFACRLIPAEAEAVFRLLPYGKVTPFATLGAGGVWWRATQNGQTIVLPPGQKKQEGFDTFFKSSGGLQISLTPSISLSAGATFRYSLTDALDQIFSGDENDAVVSLFSGVSFNLTSRGGDRDHDGVLDEYDLAPRTAEDHDGYLDHDGKPEKNVPPSAAGLVALKSGEAVNDAPPVVIHKPVRTVEEGKPLPLRAEIFTRSALEKTVVLYRKRGASWQLSNLEKSIGDTYIAVLPPEVLQEQGLEYCLIVVDKPKRAIGYSGLPTRPHVVSVLPDQRGWRAITSVAAVLGWGASAYTAFREQK
jgi:hypothetical protein